MNTTSLLIPFHNAHSIECGINCRNCSHELRAKIHGLLVALIFLDKREAVARRSPGSVLRPFSSTFSPEASSNLRHHAWVAIEEFLEGTRALWAKLNTLLTTAYDGPESDNLIREFGDAKGLYETGLAALAEAMAGNPPKDCCDKFALVALLCVASRYPVSPDDRGPLTQTNVLNGIEPWGGLLEKPEHRMMFKTIFEDQLIQHPHAANYRGQSRGYNIAMSESTVDSLLQGQQPATSNTSYEMTNLPGFDSSTSQYDRFANSEADPHPHILAGLVGANVFGDQAAYNYNVSPYFHFTNHGAFSAEPALQFNTVNSQAQPQPVVSSLAINGVDLRRTEFFSNIYSFLDRLGDLPYDLSVRGIIVKDSPKNLQRYRNRLIKQFIRPLRWKKKSIKRDILCQAILSVAKRFLKLGSLDGIEDVKKFIWGSAKVILSHKSSSYETLKKRFNEQIKSWDEAEKAQRVTDHHNPRVSPKALRPYPCQACERSFTKKCNLDRHRTKIHEKRVQRA